MSGISPPTLSIVIPALNEEQAIADTVRRCLDAREQVAREGGLGEVEVIVVNDGSSDRTEAIALGFPEATVLAFDRNRGYGAAIKCGFEHARGDLLAFLDADGTCDPRSLGALCRVLREEQASLVLGSRMGAGSRMPLVRAAGNVFFAWMLGVLSARRVVDTASGVRVIRREALPDLYPLPDGLHFTPAMSARALIENKLKLLEVPIPYAERVGRSKLSVVRDGVRFFRVITAAALCYRPGRLLLLMAGAAALAALLVGLGPAQFYLRFSRLEEWMIYRVLLSSLLLTTAGVVGFTAVVADRVAATAHGRPPAAGGLVGRLARLLDSRLRYLGVGALLVLAVLVVWPGIAEYLGVGHVTMHWSRAVLASLLLLLASTFSTSAFLLDLLHLIEAQHALGAGARPPDRLRPATAIRS